MTKKKPKRMRPTKMWAVVSNDTGSVVVVRDGRVTIFHGERLVRVIVTEVARRKQ